MDTRAGVKSDTLDFDFSRKRSTGHDRQCSVSTEKYTGSVGYRCIRKNGDLIRLSPEKSRNLELVFRVETEIRLCGLRPAGILR